MGTWTRVAITLGVVAVFVALWFLQERLSRRPGFNRRMEVWAARMAERRRAQGFRRPTFVAWAICMSVILVALLWSVR
jgi:Na+/H+-translocating membrane pyrophosphatase